MHRTESESLARDEEYLLAEGEAQLAATLALMTGFGHGCCEAHRPAIACKVADQLQGLSGDSSFSPDMRALLQRLQRRWQAVSEASAAQRAPRAEAAAETRHPSVAHALWHAPLETLQ
ncbi:hypothetical protein [Delftia lacustris]|uniref:Uncharacterized protein n=1 Tax=Delftia lacustris TaxID=558537 RepID=A0A1H3G7M5_9BURK|nr:hypothetical protein [Delftia lacustris]SDX99333.1 hypothetical protein SAMN05421547_102110 [Delftia lacustris]